MVLPEEAYLFYGPKGCKGGSVEALHVRGDLFYPTAIVYQWFNQKTYIIRCL